MDQKHARAAAWDHDAARESLCFYLIIHRSDHTRSNATSTLIIHAHRPSQDKSCLGIVGRLEAPGRFPVPDASAHRRAPRLVIGISRLLEDCRQVAWIVPVALNSLVNSSAAVDRSAHSGKGLAPHFRNLCEGLTAIWR